MPDKWMRRHAIQIVAQLPEKPEDAVAVLELAKKLVEDFLIEPKPQVASTLALKHTPLQPVRADA